MVSITQRFLEIRLELERNISNQENLSIIDFEKKKRILFSGELKDFLQDPAYRMHKQMS